jgi:hypothetical protein
VRAKEIAAKLDRPEGYAGFAPRVENVRRDLLAFLDGAHEEGRTVAGYGAAAKGNTLLNYCGVGPERVSFVVDQNPAKQNRLLPGSRIPVRAPEAIIETKPDVILILPWNLKDEIASQLSAARAWGAQFVTAIPEIRVS